MLEQVRRDLQNVKGQWKGIAAATGVKHDTLCRIASGNMGNPTIDNLQPLYDYFQSSCELAH